MAVIKNPNQKPISQLASTPSIVQAQAPKGMSPGQNPYNNPAPVAPNPSPANDPWQQINGIMETRGATPINPNKTWQQLTNDVTDTLGGNYTPPPTTKFDYNTAPRDANDWVTLPSGMRVKGSPRSQDGSGQGNQGEGQGNQGEGQGGQGYGDRMSQTLERILDMLSNPAKYDPSTDPGLQAAQKSAIDNTSRESARRGMLYSAFNKSQMGQAASKLVPEYQQMFNQNEQQKLGNQFSMLGALQGMDNTQYSRGRDAIGDTRYADDTAWSRGITEAGVTGSYETPEVKKAMTAEIPEAVRNTISGFANKAGGIQGYIDKNLKPGTAEYVYAHRMRNEKILGDEKLFAKYGKDMVKEYGMPTLQKQQFNSQESQRLADNIFRDNQMDYQKSTTKWEQWFKTEGFNWQKTQTKIENDFKERQTKIENGYKEKQLSAAERAEANSHNIAVKNYELSVSKQKLAEKAAGDSGMDLDQYNKVFTYYSDMLKGKWEPGTTGQEGKFVYEKSPEDVFKTIQGAQYPDEVKLALINNMGLQDVAKASIKIYNNSIEAARGAGVIP